MGVLRTLCKGGKECGTHSLQFMALRENECGIVCRAFYSKRRFSDCKMYAPPAGDTSGGGSGSQQQQQKFKDCLNKYGDANAKANLTYQNFLDAEQAAANAQIDASELLALWDNENSLSPNMHIGKRGPKGEVGAMQIRPGAVKELSNLGQLPADWNTNLTGNLTAGATYYADMSDVFGVPGTKAAAAYNGGQNGYQNNSGAQAYQNSFNQRNAMFTNLVNCVRGFLP